MDDDFDSGNDDARIVYWAAYLGKINPVKYAVEIGQISPFTKCFDFRIVVGVCIVHGCVTSIVLKQQEVI